MRFSKIVKGGLIVAMAAAVVGIPAGSALADIKGTFAVHPNEAAATSNTTFKLTFVNADGATSGATNADNPQCIVFTLGDGTTDFSSLSNPGAVLIDGAATDWTGVVDNSASPPTLSVSGT